MRLIKMLSKDSYKLDKKVNNVRSARSLKKITTRSKFHRSLDVFCMYFHSYKNVENTKRKLILPMVCSVSLWQYLVIYVVCLMSTCEMP